MIIKIKFSKLKNKKIMLYYNNRLKKLKIAMMKNIKALTILLFCLTISFVSCKDKETKETPQQETLVPLKAFDSPSQQSTGSVWHYTCNNGCEGGSSAVGNCSTCGSALVHNQAFHNNTNTTTNTTPLNTTPANTATTPSPEPSQNAAGIWHYTCNNGCSGGAGSAGNCSTCGNALAHNTAYHQ